MNFELEMESISLKVRQSHQGCQTVRKFHVATCYLAEKIFMFLKWQIFIIALKLLIIN